VDVLGGHEAVRGDGRVDHDDLAAGVFGGLEEGHPLAGYGVLYGVSRANHLLLLSSGRAFAGSDVVYVRQVKAPTSSHPQAEIKVRSTRIKIGSRCVPPASHRGAEVLTYARMIMSHQKFASVEEAAAASASHLGAGKPPDYFLTGRSR
jgi:hypothetical protein